MIAIHTKYIPASNVKGARIKAYTVSGFRVTIDYPHEYWQERAHFQAVRELVKKHGLDWNIDVMTWGDSADGKGYCFTFPQSQIEID